MNQQLNSPDDLGRRFTSAEGVVAQTAGAMARAASAAGPPKVTALTATSIFKALRRRQTLALGVATLALGICGPTAWFAVPAGKFKAQARLILVALPPKVLFRTVETETSGGDDYKRYQSTQLTLVTSQLVLNAALLDKNVSKCRMIREQADPIAWLQENIKPTFVAGSEVMEISLMGDDPGQIASIVNAIKKAYMDEVVNVDTKRRADRHAKLKGIKESYAEILKERRERLRKNAEAVGSDNPETLALKQQYIIQNANSLMTQLMTIQAEKRRLEAAAKARPQAEIEDDAPLESPIAENDINDLIDQSQVVRALASDLAKQEAAYHEHVLRWRQASRGGGDATGRTLRDAVAATKAQLATKRRELRPLAIRQLQAQNKVEQVKASNVGAQDLVILAELEKSLTAEIKTIQDQSKSLNVKTLDLTALSEEVTELQRTTSQVSAEVEALTVELQAPPRVRTIEDAVPPLTRDERRRYAVIAMITAGAFFAGLFGVAFLELQTQKVDSIDLVPSELGLPVVGTLPMVRSKTARQGGALARVPSPKDKYWNNVLLESVDAARTMLVHVARAESHRVVMITSAVSSEGKTSLSSHLATSLARSGLRTLLIDGDLRSPSIHRLFDLPVASGLSELLRGEVDTNRRHRRHRSPGLENNARRPL